MEDFVTWVDTSKLKRTILSYNDEVSGFSVLMMHLMVNNTRSSMILIFCRDRN